MKRRSFEIDQEKCNGCGACAQACHEGAIGMVDGKAQLLRDDYCDGLGDCLPACPTGAITFVEREAAAYDEQAVKENQRKKQQAHGGCPGQQNAPVFPPGSGGPLPLPSPGERVSQLGQWPCQIKLVPVNAPYFDGAKLLIAADCTAYAYAGLHQDFMRAKSPLSAVPSWTVWITAKNSPRSSPDNNIQSVTILRMEVPCCGGLEMAAKKALQQSGKFIPWQVVTLSVDGKILDKTN